MARLEFQLILHFLDCSVLYIVILRSDSFTRPRLIAITSQVYGLPEIPTHITISISACVYLLPLQLNRENRVDYADHAHCMSVSPSLSLFLYTGDFPLRLSVCLCAALASIASSVGDQRQLKSVGIMRCVHPPPIQKVAGMAQAHTHTHTYAVCDIRQVENGVETFIAVTFPASVAESLASFTANLSDFRPQQLHSERRGRAGAEEGPSKF